MPQPKLLAPLLAEQLSLTKSTGGGNHLSDFVFVIIACYRPGSKITGDFPFLSVGSLSRAWIEDKYPIRKSLDTLVGGGGLLVCDFIPYKPVTPEYKHNH